MYVKILIIFYNDKANSSVLSSYVPTSRTVNNKALSSNISLTASDVGAFPSSGGQIRIWPDSVGEWFFEIVQNGNWTNGYGFKVSRTGTIQISKYTNGSSTVIRNI